MSEASLCDAPNLSPAIRWEKCLWVLFFACVAMPFLMLADIYALALHATLLTGHWPSYNDPDPTSIQQPLFMLHEASVGVLLSLYMAGVFVAGLTLLFLSLWRPGRKIWMGILLYGLEFLLPFIAIWPDPGGVWNWFFD